jgi:hypothetical protein
MPTNKDFKRLVRARMRKTGESYTAARMQLVKRTPSLATASTDAAQPVKPDYAALAGMSDAAIKAKTGCDWERWVWALDRVKAYEWPHRAIADYVHEKYKVQDWWTQAVTVGYERIKGLRAIGQRRDGHYEATKSKVFAAPLARVYRAFHNARTRQRWLGAVDVTVRTAARDKSMRVAWPDQTLVQIYFTAKGAAKSQVAVQHTKLPNRAAATTVKEFWADRLAALGAVLTRAAPARRRA